MSDKPMTLTSCDWQRVIGALFESNWIAGLGPDGEGRAVALRRRISDALPAWPHTPAAPITIVIAPIDLFLIHSALMGHPAARHLCYAMLDQVRGGSQ